MSSIPKGRTKTLAPISQPGDTGLASKVAYKLPSIMGNNATANQQHRHGSPKFFDDASNRPSIPNNGVQMTPGLRSE